MTSSHSVPSLTNTSSCSTCHSVLTDGIAITSKAAPAVQIKPDPNFIDIYDGGGLSDHDETKGCKCDVAILSPPKGKMCLNSKVSILSHINNIFI